MSGNIILTLKVYDRENNIIEEKSGENFVDLVVTHEYQEGDSISLFSSRQNIHVDLMIDDALGKSRIYLVDNFKYYIPFGEKRVNISPKIFYGKIHYLSAKITSSNEVNAYRNLALNPCDQHHNLTSFPHAAANVETRGESVFAAQNAIDGVLANLSHGFWPYASWGINRREDAEITIQFGRTVKTDKAVIYTRADFPHDSWWKQATLKFSDGSVVIAELEKSEKGQVIEFGTKNITWITMCNLIKSDDPSPFPALTQLEIYGTEGFSIKKEV